MATTPNADTFMTTTILSDQPSAAVSAAPHHRDPPTSNFIDSYADDNILEASLQLSIPHSNFELDSNRKTMYTNLSKDFEKPLEWKTKKSRASKTQSCTWSNRKSQDALLWSRMKLFERTRSLSIL